MKLYDEKKYTISEIETIMKLSASTLYRYLKQRESDV
ncbi:helix-turn-helix domain-containing protein [Vagococcus allomyrinae]|nr:helix-turn-helix domain-containing protein [Vagococcus allomyrinae]